MEVFVTVTNEANGEMVDEFIIDSLKFDNYVIGHLIEAHGENIKITLKKVNT